MDPTHKSYWNQNSFWYYTRDAQAQFIDNVDERFGAVSLYTYFPSDWHKENQISYVWAQLIALKPEYLGPKPQAG